jgi:hypothetical protein
LAIAPDGNFHRNTHILDHRVSVFARRREVTVTEHLLDDPPPTLEGVQKLRGVLLESQKSEYRCSVPF